MQKMIKSKFVGVYHYESVERRHDGRNDICFYISYKVDSKKFWKKIGWRSEGYSAKFAADERARVLQAQNNTTAIPTNSTLTFDEAFRIFDEKHLSINIKKPQDERQRYLLYLKESIGYKRLDKITTLDIESIKNKYAKKLSPASIRHILSDVRRVYRKIIYFGLYDGFDPTSKMKMPKVDNARTRHLSKDEAALLLRTLKPRSETWHDIARISLYSGMRLSEIIRLSVQDINIEEETLDIRDSKNGSRSIYMNNEVKAIVMKRLERVPNKPTQRLFTKKDGKPLQEGQTGKTFRETVKALGFNPFGTDRRHRVCFHTLRHTFCSWLAMEGVPLYTIGELVGHSSHEMTKRYSHLCRAKAKQTACILNNIKLGEF